MGMAPEKLNTLFKPFSQADEVLNPQPYTLHPTP